MAHWESFLRDKFNLQRYPNSSQALKDAKTALEHYTTLKPEVKSFVFPDGRNRELVCLTGTIPVNYRGTTYNIPICLWLQERHPFIAPIAYVVPTADMQIKAGRHVDASGRVYLPFLTDWKHPQADLFQLIQMLCLIFAEQPPVYARRQPAPAGGYPQPPRPSYQAYGQPTPYPNNPLPPGYYQAGPAQMPMPAMPQASAQPSPPYPTTTASRPTRPPDRPPPPVRPPQPTQPYPPQGGFPMPGVTQQSNPTYPSTQNYPPTTSTAGTDLSRNTQGSFKLTPDMMKASLKSGIEDKIRRRLNEVFAQAQVEMESLKKKELELNEGTRKLENMIKQIETEEAEVTKDIATLTQKNKEIQETVATLQQQSDKMNIDEAVVPTTPLYKQILELYAEENSLDDTMYYLGEALRREKIELDVFLKHVRSLSRKQFMSRALLQKARKTAGLSAL